MNGKNAKAMPLLSHLNELRSRAFKSAIGIALASCIGWIFYEKIIARLANPICDLEAATSAGDNSCGILYINGVQNASGAFTPFVGTNPTIELGTTKLSFNWEGSFAINRFYNRVLSASEVLQNYNATKGRYR